MQATARKLSFYISIDYDFLDDPRTIALSGWAVKTFLYLQRYQDNRQNGKRGSGWTIPVSQATLAEKVNCCISSIQNYIKELDAAGFIKTKDTKNKVYQIDKQARQHLPKGSVKFTDVSNRSFKNINNPPQKPPLKAQQERKDGEGDEKFNKVRQALINKNHSPIPSDKQLQQISNQIPSDRPIDALAHAITHVELLRIADLYKLYHAARKAESQFWELIKGHQEHLEAEELSKRERQRTREVINQIKQPAQSKREPEPEREKPEPIDKNHQRIMAAIAGIGESAAKPVTELKPWSREDALKLDRETREDKDGNRYIGCRQFRYVVDDNSTRSGGE